MPTSLTVAMRQISEFILWKQLDFFYFLQKQTSNHIQTFFYFVPDQALLKIFKEIFKLVLIKVHNSGIAK